MHTATYTTLMTIIAADVRTPIVAAPIAMIPIGTVMAAVCVPVSAVSSTTICTPIVSAVNASNAPG